VFLHPDRVAAGLPDDDELADPAQELADPDVDGQSGGNPVATAG
jgi:hypothetical protein